MHAIVHAVHFADVAKIDFQSLLSLADEGIDVSFLRPGIYHVFRKCFIAIVYSQIFFNMLNLWSYFIGPEKTNVQSLIDMISLSQRSATRIENYIYTYYMTFSGIPSGSKSIKTLSRQL